MRKRLAAGIFTLAVLGMPARAVDRVDVDRAIERGVAVLRRMQGQDGRWSHDKIGATALAGLTLLECGALADDKAVRRAADVVRKASVTLTDTYSISLSIFFLDRLGDPQDVALIESLMVRLLGGQNASGGWTYACPAVAAEEVRRLQDKLNERKEPIGRREPPKPDAVRRTTKDLPVEIQQQLATLERGAAPNRAALLGASDNSNTQFAALALWVGRRHGLPVERTLTRLDARFRRSQLGNGGWSYTGLDETLATTPDPLSTASMTCAGLLALAIADGATLEYLKEHKPDAKLPDLGKDVHLNRGLQALGACIENPRNLPVKRFDQLRPEERIGGRTYYFLWSLERVAVALDLRTIGKKDWYGWGAEILLANQQGGGDWSGDYGGTIDSCFALLFLKRANLVRDLTGQLEGKIKDPGEREIRAGGIGGGSLRGVRSGVKSGIERGSGKPIAKADTEGGRLADALVKAPADRRPALIDQMEKAKGTQYTEALASAIPQLEGESHRKARDALAERLTRMKAAVLIVYLQDDDAEIRRAAALAVAMKENKELIPNLIPLLRDREALVVRAAHAALKALTGEDFGPDAKASREECDKAALKWLQWLRKRRMKDEG